MDTTKGKVQLVAGNMALLQVSWTFDLWIFAVTDVYFGSQVQAIVVGLLAALVAHLMDLVMSQKFELDHLLLLCACGIVTASVASLILGSHRQPPLAFT